jgi:hypothetical protein
MSPHIASTGDEADVSWKPVALAAHFEPANSREPWFRKRWHLKNFGPVY